MNKKIKKSKKGKKMTRKRIRAGAASVNSKPKTPGPNDTLTPGELNSIHESYQNLTKKQKKDLETKLEKQADQADKKLQKEMGERDKKIEELEGKAGKATPAEKAKLKKLQDDKQKVEEASKQMEAELEAKVDELLAEKNLSSGLEKELAQMKVELKRAKKRRGFAGMTNKEVVGFGIGAVAVTLAIVAAGGEAFELINQSGDGSFAVTMWHAISDLFSFGSQAGH